MIVAANACCTATTCDVDGAAIDGNCSRFISSNARFLRITAVDGQGARAVDGQVGAVVV